MPATVAKIQVVVDELEAEREDGWQAAEEETERIVKENSLEAVKLPRQTTAPRRYRGGDQTKHASVSDYLRMEYRKMVDGALCRIKELFLDNPDLQKYKALEQTVRPLGLSKR